jgi:hypothetical protein
MLARAIHDFTPHDIIVELSALAKVSSQWIQLVQASAPYITVLAHASIRWNIDWDCTSYARTLARAHHTPSPSSVPAASNTISLVNCQSQQLSGRR